MAKPLLKQITLEEAIKMFKENYLSLTSELHKANFDVVVMHLFKVVDKSSAINDVNVGSMIKFINQLKPLVRTATLRTYLRYLKTFFNFLISEEIIEKSPVNKKIIPRQEYKSIITFEKDMVDRILAEAKRRDPQFYNVLVLLGATGIRPCDLLRLKVRNINLDKDYMTVMMSKTSREITFPLYDSLKKFILENFPTLAEMRPDEPIFKGLTVSSIGKRFRRLKKKLNINEKYTYTLKTFRKTFASSLVEKEFDGLRIADLLGHTSVNTTRQYYLGRRTSSLKEKLNNANFDVSV